MTAVEYFVFKAATVSAIATAGFSFDDDPRSILKADWPRPPPGHTTSGAVRTGEGNHEMPGLPYPAFRKVNAEPGAASRPPTATRLADIGGQENTVCARLSPKGAI